MGIEGHPFPTNTVASSFQRGKFKVLTSNRAREARIVYSERQILANEYHEIKKKQDQQNSRCDCLETSKAGEMRRCPIIRILLKKWQWQKERSDASRKGLLEISRDA